MLLSGNPELVDDNLPQLDGSVFIIRRYSRLMIKSNPSVLFAFGDNLARVGYGGQAKEARGEKNVVGIPTKISPALELSDEDFEMVKQPIVQAFVILAEHLRNGHDVVWPFDGVGTGLARLPQAAPLIFQGIENCKEALFMMAKSVNTLDI